MKYLLSIIAILSSIALFSQTETKSPEKAKTQTQAEPVIKTSTTINATEAEPAEKINWLTWEEAYKANEENPKKVFVEVYTEWCGYCKKMDKSTFSDPEVISYINENFHPIKFDAEQKDTIYFNDRAFGYNENQGRKGCHTLAFGLLNGRMGYPSSVLLDEDFARIMTSPGYKNSKNLLQELSFAKEEKYKETSWGNYQLTLRPEKPAEPSPAHIPKKVDKPTPAKN